MRAFSTAIAVAALIGQAFSSPVAAPVIKVTPGGVNDIIITKQNTLNSTVPAPASPSGNETHILAAQATEALPLALVNNFAGQVNAYVTGLNSQNQLVMLQPNGQFFFPSASAGQSTPQPINANVAIPLGPKGSTTHITIPDFISSARVWFAVGTLQFFTVSNGAGGASLVEPSSNNPSDPSANVNWGFVELTNNASGLFANISYVDFVGLVLGMALTAGDGSQQVAKGLSAGAVNSICNSLIAQAKVDGQQWGNLCQVGSNGAFLRAIAPSDFTAINPNNFQNYWTSYVNSVWSHYTTNTLTINTQTGSGNVACKVANNQLTCAGDNRAYNMPNQVDIFGCNSGPFAIISTDNDVHRAVVPRLCAAFNRATLLLNGGNVQPSLSSNSYYTTSPNNFYSKFVHQNEVDGKGYAFSYDDVNPAGENQSGVVSDGSPQLLTITVGGPS